MNMKDVTAVCEALGGFRFEAGINGVLLPAPVLLGYKDRPDRRIQPIGGIGHPGEWRLVELPEGRALSGVLRTKADLHRALLWQLALDDNQGMLPPERVGYVVFARRHQTRFTGSYIFAYRKGTKKIVRPACGHAKCAAYVACIYPAKRGSEPWPAKRA